MDCNPQSNQSFSAEKFVDSLLEEGSKIPCDDSNNKFENEQNLLPYYYNETLFKRGQQFFHDNIFALLYTKLLGLLSVLAIPTILDILIFTKMSGNDMTAYRRYLATIFHMVIWYKNELSPTSPLWSSINDVKLRHNSASKRGCKAGLHRISQKDMALTQFGFMGFAVTKREKVGLHNTTEEEFKSFIHVWRVIGHCIGIEERFNICRESVQETTDICNLLIDRAFRPNVEKKDEKFIEMTTYLIDGMWCMNPTLGDKTYLTLLYDLVQSENNNNNNNDNKNQRRKITECDYVELGLGQKIHLVILRFVMWSIKFRIFRLYHNYVQFMTLWFMRVFPFLAYYKFGKANSHVSVAAIKS